MLKYLTYFKLVTLLMVILLTVNGCGTEYEPNKQELPKNDAVEPDGILETVTWNIEHFGNENYGPSDDFLQTENVLQITDSLNADLYAFQEIYNQEELNEIISNMKGYRGFTADHISYNQRMAFVFNSNTIDSLSSGVINDVRAEYQEDWNHYWADRPPMYFEFTYSYGNTDTEMDFLAIVIHGKANTGSNSAEYEAAYDRRKKAAEGLYYYLRDERPDENIILLGDYNDDMDESIFYYSENNYAETPYQLFVEDTQNFDVITKILSDSGESASVNYPDIIDHITISDELFDIHVESSTNVFKAPQNFISNYGQTTSDHLPVWAKFNITH